MNITKETRMESYVQTMPDAPKRRQLIYTTLKENGPMTAPEIAKVLGFTDLNSVKPRLSELCKDGMVEAFGKQYNESTHRNNAVYRIGEIAYDDLPRKSRYPLF